MTGDDAYVKVSYALQGEPHEVELPFVARRRPRRRRAHPSALTGSRDYSQRNDRGDDSAVASTKVTASTATSSRWCRQPSPCQMPRSSDTA